MLTVITYSENWNDTWPVLNSGNCKYSYQIVSSRRFNSQMLQAETYDETLVYAQSTKTWQRQSFTGLNTKKNEKWTEINPGQKFGLP